MPCFASSLFAISTTFKNIDSKKGEVRGEMRVKIPRDRNVPLDKKKVITVF